MPEKRVILVWLPLPPLAGWRGEGIAQTLENILVNFSDTSCIRILVSKAHYWEAVEAFQQVAHIEVSALSLTSLILGRKPKKPIGPKSALDIAELALASRSALALRFKRLFDRLSLVKYAVVLGLYTLLQRFGLIFRRADCVWSPSPAIGFSERLGGKHVVSFWDPFVFEYREFSDVAPYLFVKFLKLFERSDCVITQSKVNSSYLTQVFGVRPLSIQVIKNGCPDYSGLISNDLLLRRARFRGALPVNFRKEIISDFFGRALTGSNKNNIFGNFINESIEFRLFNRFRDSTKIIMVSTQARPYKGVAAMLALFDELIRRRPEHDYLFIITSQIPAELRRRYTWFSDRVFELVRVSNKLHAHLYLISDVAIHPSFAEGGVGVYPQYEAASLGVPALANQGRHMNELIEEFPEVGVIVCDFTNSKAAAQKIEEILDDSEARLSNIAAIQASRVDWVAAAKKYEDCFLKL